MKNLLMLISLFFIVSCGDNGNMPIDEIATQGPGNLTYAQTSVGFNQVRPIFEAKCRMCHNGSTHPKDWTDYEIAKANLKNISDRIFVVGNMPAAGALSAEEKATIKAWVDAGGPLEGATITTTTPPLASAPVQEPPPVTTSPPSGSTPTIPSSGSGISFDQVKTVFEAKCKMCHNGSTHPKDWTVYETAKANLGALNDRLFITGNMPAVGSLSEAEKSTIKTWINAGGPLLASGGNTGGTTPPAPTPTPTPTPLPPYSGEYLVQTKCLSCHGSGAVNLDTPLLHGQEKKYLVRQLNNFKTQRRKDLIMNSMNSIAQSLSDGDIQNIADYLSRQSPCSVLVNINPLGGSVSAGQKEAGQCFKCHTESAPVLKGQKTGYLKFTLNNFKNLKREFETMNEEAEDLSAADINNLAAYFNSKRSCN